MFQDKEAPQVVVDEKEKKVESESDEEGNDDEEDVNANDSDDSSFALEGEEHSSNPADRDSDMMDVDTPDNKTKETPKDDQPSKKAKRKLIIDDDKIIGDLDKKAIQEVTGKKNPITPMSERRPKRSCRLLNQ